jgi:hypothetical protein
LKADLAVLELFQHLGAVLELPVQAAAAAMPVAAPSTLKRPKDNIARSLGGFVPTTEVVLARTVVPCTTFTSTMAQDLDGTIA